MSRPASIQHGPGSICLLHAGAIGDFILALTIVQDVRARGGNASVVVLGREDIASLAVGCGGVDSVRSQESLPLHTLHSDAGPIDPRCADCFGRFDLILNMLCGEGEVFERRLLEIVSARVVTLDPVPKEPTQHITDTWRAHLRASGIATTDERPRLRFSADDLRRGRGALRAVTHDEDRRAVLLHPGSGGRRKCWSLDGFERLAEGLARRGLSPVFMIGPVETELHGPTLGARLGQSAPVVSEEDLQRAAMCVAAASGYVGNDAGMTHIAAAAGTPTVAVFGPTDPAVWRPLGENVAVVRGVPTGTFDGVTPARIEHALLALMDDTRRPPADASGRG